MRKISGDFLQIDRKSRAKTASLDVSTRPVEERIFDFDDVVIPMTGEQAMLEASRCIQCPDPAPCMLACPVHNDIPSAMWLIEQGRFVEAAEIYRQTSSLPEVCGRVCPQEQLCQGSCSHKKSIDPVLTGPLEAFVTDYQRMVEDYKLPVGDPSGKHVAVVGSGPAGLACAKQLVSKGHQITVFEAKPGAGGLMTYGIPGFKLPKPVVMEQVEDLEKVGVKFIFDTYIGKDITVDDLFAKGFDAVFIGVGANVDSPMKAEGVDLPGVRLAGEFLMRCNIDCNEMLPEEMHDRQCVGDKVVVIGGGDTASDCLRTAIRMGAKDVSCLYRRTLREMPGGCHDREMAIEEGANYEFLTQPIRFIPGDDGNLAQVECVRMKLGAPDDSGRRRPIPVEGSNFIVDADTAVLALGYWPDETIGKTTPELETHKWGLLVADPHTGATSRPGVYAGGDNVTGPDLVVTAMAAGRRAAQAIDEYLMK